MHNRFAYPAACLVLMLVGVPLGVASRRGGKSSAWVFTILLVVVYYSLSLIGTPWAGRTGFPLSSRCGRPTSCLPRPASFCCGRWPAAAAS
jgi:lipopolysaccharide export LptBFGC system permease protein LptF